MKIFRSTYEFTHTEATGLVSFKAFTEQGARNKMREYVIEKMYGSGILFYPSGPVEKVMSEVICKKVDY